MEIRSHKDIDIAITNAKSKIANFISQNMEHARFVDEFDEILQEISKMSIELNKATLKAGFENCTSCDCPCYGVTFPCLNSKPLLIRHKMQDFQNIIKSICTNQCCCQYKMYDKMDHIQFIKSLKEDITINSQNLIYSLKIATDQIIRQFIERFLQENDKKIDTNNMCVICKKVDKQLIEFCNKKGSPSHHSHFDCLNNYISNKFRDEKICKCPKCGNVFNKSILEKQEGLNDSKNHQ